MRSTGIDTFNLYELVSDLALSEEEINLSGTKDHQHRVVVTAGVYTAKWRGFEGEGSSRREALQALTRLIVLSLIPKEDAKT